MSIAVGIIMSVYIFFQQTQMEHLKVEANYCNQTMEQLPIPYLEQPTQPLY